MLNTELKEWRERLGLSRQQAADKLEIAINTYDNYERGFRYMGPGKHRDADIPKSVELACAAIAIGITDYSGEEIEVS